MPWDTEDTCEVCLRCDSIHDVRDARNARNVSYRKGEDTETLERLALFVSSAASHSPTSSSVSHFKFE